MQKHTTSVFIALFICFIFTLTGCFSSGGDDDDNNINNQSSTPSISVNKSILSVGDTNCPAGGVMLEIGYLFHYQENNILVFFSIQKQDFYERDVFVL